MIEWRDAYSVGIEEIDGQHQRLFSFFNDFEIVINEGDPTHYMKNSFALLEAYAAAHFGFEEKCMHQYKCPMAQKNKAEHQNFITKVEGYKRVFESGEFGQDLFVEMHDFIEEWILGHIINVDSHLKVCVKK